MNTWHWVQHVCHGSCLIFSLSLLFTSILFELVLIRLDCGDSRARELFSLYIHAFGIHAHQKGARYILYKTVAHARSMHMHTTMRRQPNFFFCLRFPVTLRLFSFSRAFSLVRGRIWMAVACATRIKGVKQQLKGKHLTQPKNRINRNAGFKCVYANRVSFEILWHAH